METHAKDASSHGENATAEVLGPGDELEAFNSGYNSEVCLCVRREWTATWTHAPQSSAPDCYVVRASGCRKGNLHV